jgi:hypothetical protein
MSVLVYPTVHFFLSEEDGPANTVKREQPLAAPIPNGSFRDVEHLG